MKILVQWAKDAPGDWEEVDSRHWHRSPSKPDPTGLGLGLNNTPGWVHALNVQGIVFSAADHYAVEHVDDEEIRITTWNDDPSWVNPGEREAHVWSVRTLAPDPSMKGAINTRQSVEHYAEPVALARYTALDIPCHPWADFVSPVASVVRHGKYTSDALHESHRGTRRLVGWREFTDGLDAAELVDGKVPPQRALGRYEKPKGTRTYYASDTAQAVGLYTADVECAFLTTTGSAGNVTDSCRKSDDEGAFCFTGPSGEPDAATWPTGTYRFQLDITAAGADLTYGMLTRGGTNGLFSRVNAALDTEVATHVQDEAAFSGTGLKLATYTGSWAGSTATDRVIAYCAVINANNKDTQDLVLQANEADDYIDGPWPKASETFNRSANDTAVVSDSIVRGSMLIMRSATDTNSVAESVARELTSPGQDYTRSASDSCIVTDQIRISREQIRSSSDTVSTTDTAARTRVSDRQVSDTVNVSDSVNRVSDADRVLSDTVSVTDDVVALSELIRDVTDAVSIAADQVFVEVVYTRSVESAVSAVDSVTPRRYGDLSVILSDTAIVVSDLVEIRTAGVFLVAVQDTRAVSDTTARSATFERIIDDWRGRSTP